MAGWFESPRVTQDDSPLGRIYQFYVGTFFFLSIADPFITITPFRSDPTETDPHVKHLSLGIGNNVLILILSKTNEWRIDKFDVRRE